MRGAVGRWFITPHAVGRYRHRIMPDAGLSYKQALTALIAASETAHFVRHEAGYEYWRGPRPHRLRFRVKPAEQFGRLPVLMTVLPAYDPPGSA